ncbi:Uncharacterized conserved protein [Phaffia rhodozyma]|uniref:Uncharacterized conserved protein n=1 Tax=Phaffia rhodozyma TaxID=264483 RepID=A0A0F7SLX4_PHARH|nr:Uncharacterized conserved protein [Phaffia rhodozyma]
MATIQDRQWTEEYSGLLTNLYVALAVTGICGLSTEIMRGRRRRRGRLGKDDRSGNISSRDSWEFGYLYQARAWSKIPSPMHPRGPLMSLWQAHKFPEDRLPALIGMDHTVHVRFLRACFYFLLIHILTTLPILLPIHLVYAPSNVSRTSMLRASLSSLILSVTAQKYLWVHLSILLWLMVTWVAILLWFSWGCLRYRRINIEADLQAAERSAYPPKSPSCSPPSVPSYDGNNMSQTDPTTSIAPDLSAQSLHPTRSVLQSDMYFSAPLVTPDQKLIENLGPRGWRFRTLMVSNVPPDMRDPEVLRTYFQQGLDRNDILVNRSNQRVSFFGTDPAQATCSLDIERRLVEEQEAEPITEVVIVRRLLELEKLRERRADVLKRLEEAHVKLINNVMTAVIKELKGSAWNGRWLGRHFGGVPLWIPHQTAEIGGKYKPEGHNEKRADEVADLPSIEKGNSKKYDVDREDEVEGMDERERLNFLVEKLRRFVDEAEDQTESSQGRTSGSMENLNDQSSGLQEEREGEEKEENMPTIWEVLHSLPRSLLDPYQPLYYSSLTAYALRKHNPPLINYLTPKLGLLSSLIEEHRSQPIDTFSAASTAFVTFRSPELARGVLKKMKSHPKRALACNLSPAPDYRDLEWLRLMTARYRTEYVKGWVVAIGVWAFIIFWIIPITLFAGLVSVKNIATIIPHLQDVLDKYPKAATIITSLLPTLLVSGLTLLIPLLLFLISRNAETIVTKSQMHNIMLSRYYRFLMCNVVIFFCVGVASLEAFVTSFRKNFTPINLLRVIASTFPQAAPFFAGWLIVQTALHSMIEYMLLGLPLITYFGLRKAQVPRRRSSGTEPRFFSDAYWKPLHILCLSITVLFAILNPLVLPFGFVYFAVALPIFKNQMIHVYQHQYETQGQRPVIRFVRYTLDGHALAQIVFMAMMVILKKSALIGLTCVLIVITLASKIILTRALKSRFRVLRISEAEGLHHVSQGYPLPCVPSRISLETSPYSATPVAGNALTPAPVTASNNGGNENDGTYTYPPSAASAPDRLGFVPDNNPPNPLTGRNVSTLPSRGSVLLPFPLARKPLPFEMSSIRRSAPWTERVLSVPSRLLIAPILSRFDAHYSGEIGNGKRNANYSESDGNREPSSHSSNRVSTDSGCQSGVPPSGNNKQESKIREVKKDKPDNEVDQGADVRTRPALKVTPRAGPLPWTDRPIDSRLYGYQPSYSRPLETLLWLPRHPLRTLDLDDTVEINQAFESSHGGSGHLGIWAMNENGEFCPTIIEERDEIIEEISAVIKQHLDDDEAEEEMELGRKVSVRSNTGMNASYSPPSPSGVASSPTSRELNALPVSPTALLSIPSVTFSNEPQSPTRPGPMSSPKISPIRFNRARARTLHIPRRKTSTSSSHRPIRHFSLSRTTNAAPSDDVFTTTGSPQRSTDHRGRSNSQRSGSREDVLQLIAKEELAASRRDRAEASAIVELERSKTHSRVLRRLGLVNAGND